MTTKSSYSIQGLHETLDSTAKSDETDSFMIEFEGQLAFTFLDFDELSTLMNTKESIFFVIVAALDKMDMAGSGFKSPPRFSQICWFNKLISKIRKDNPGKRLIISTGRNPGLMTTCALLLGSVLVLEDGVSPQAVKNGFNPIFARFLEYGDGQFQEQTMTSKFTVSDCWHALRHASRMGWLNLSEDPDIDTRFCIDVEEYCHYDGPINGNLHVIIPSKLIAFSSPSLHEIDPATATRQWADINGTRHFSPGYYSELLGDFDVKLVVNCSGTSYDTSCFHAAGIAVEHLPGVSTHTSSSHLLQHTDRFLTLARLAPGAIAVHGDKKCLEPLLIASLLQHHGFPSADAALAWLRILRPTAPTPHMQPRWHTAFAVTVSPPRIVAAPTSTQRHAADVHRRVCGPERGPLNTAAASAGERPQRECERFAPPAAADFLPDGHGFLRCKAPPGRSVVCPCLKAGGDTADNSALTRKQCGSGIQVSPAATGMPVAATDAKADSCTSAAVRVSQGWNVLPPCEKSFTAGL